MISLATFGMGGAIGLMAGLWIGTEIARRAFKRSAELMAQVASNLETWK